MTSSLHTRLLLGISKHKQTKQILELEAKHIEEYDNSVWVESVLSWVKRKYKDNVEEWLFDDEDVLVWNVVHKMTNRGRCWAYFQAMQSDVVVCSGPVNAHQSSWHYTVNLHNSLLFILFSFSSPPFLYFSWMQKFSCTSAWTEETNNNLTLTVRFSFLTFFLNPCNLFVRDSMPK